VYISVEGISKEEGEKKDHTVKREAPFEGRTEGKRVPYTTYVEGSRSGIYIYMYLYMYVGGGRRRRRESEPKAGSLAVVLCGCGQQGRIWI